MLRVLLEEKLLHNIVGEASVHCICGTSAGGVVEVPLGDFGEEARYQEVHNDSALLRERDSDACEYLAEEASNCKELSMGMGLIQLAEDLAEYLSG